MIQALRLFTMVGLMAILHATASASGFQVERTPLILSLADGKAITRTVENGRVVRYQSCDVKLAGIKTNNDLIDTLNSLSVSCQNLNGTWLDLNDVGSMASIDRGFSRILKKNLELENDKRVSSYKKNFYILGIDAVLTTAAASFALVLGRRTFVRAVLGSIHSLTFGVLTIAASINTYRAFLNKAPVSIDEALQEFKLSREELHDLDVSPSDLFNIFKQSVDEITRLVLPFQEA